MQLLIQSIFIHCVFEDNKVMTAYVLQPCGLSSGAFLENIPYRKNHQEYKNGEVVKAPRLWEFASGLSPDRQTNIGKCELSLIVFDESIKTLDSYIKSQINELMNQLRGVITVIII